MSFDDFKSHFSTQISTDIVKFATDTALKTSRYLFYKTVLGVQYAWCTHCNQTHLPAEKLKHKQETLATCSKCKSSCRVRAEGMSRKYMEDKAVSFGMNAQLLTSNP